MFVFALPPGAAMADEAHYLWLPYCVSGGGWNTGLNVKTYYMNEELTVRFSGPTSTYATNVEVSLDARGRWTGSVQQILASDGQYTEGDFQSPSLVHFYSTKGPFTVTQFIFSSMGFGYQTFYSAPGTSAASAWPYIASESAASGTSGMVEE